MNTASEADSFDEIREGRPAMGMDRDNIHADTSSRVGTASRVGASGRSGTMSDTAMGMDRDNIHADTSSRVGTASRVGASGRSGSMSMTGSQGSSQASADSRAMTSAQAEYNYEQDTAADLLMQKI